MSRPPVISLASAVAKEIELVATLVGPKGKSIVAFFKNKQNRETLKSQWV